MNQRGVSKLFFVLCVTLGASMSIMFAPVALSANASDDALTAVERGAYAAALPALEREARKSVIPAKYLLPLATCYTETRQFAKAEKILVQARNRQVIGAQTQLATFYYRTYRFAEAFVEADKALGGKLNEARKSEMEQLKRVSQMGVLMLQNVDGIQVLDSIVVSKKSFINSYTISKESGSIYPFASFFSEPDSTGMLSVYENEKQTRVLYSKANDKGTINLFSAYRMGDKYEQGAQLKGLINSTSNETFPFLLSDGVTIYFSSDKEGGLGGYDLYVSRYNLSSDQYLAPENMGMPYSSVYNDYLLVIDEKNHLGWFASDRYQSKDKVTIYIFEFTGERNVVVDPQKALATATLQSISSTWKKGSDYTQRRQQIKSIGVQEEAQKEASIRFVVNDRQVYTSLSDFKKPKAAQLFQLYAKDESTLVLLEEELTKQREQYAKTAKGSKERTILTSAILKNEQSQGLLLQRLKDRAKEIRKMELEKAL